MPRESLDRGFSLTVPRKSPINKAFGVRLSFLTLRDSREHARVVKSFKGFSITLVVALGVRPIDRAKFNYTPIALALT